MKGMQSYSRRVFVIELFRWQMGRKGCYFLNAWKQTHLLLFYPNSLLSFCKRGVSFETACLQVHAYRRDHSENVFKQNIVRYTKGSNLHIVNGTNNPRKLQKKSTFKSP
jgi:hypothetical protein